MPADALFTDEKNMSDFLLELSRNPQARKMIQSIGLPIPLPQPLARDKGPWAERPLFDRDIAVWLGDGSAMAGFVAFTLCAAGANPHLVHGDAAPFRAPGEAFGRPAEHLDLASPPEGLRLHGAVFDATGIADVASLRQLYDVFHALVGSLRACSHVVVIGRPVRDAATVEAAAAQMALEGFVRSLAKEIGRRGSTAQLLLVDAGAEDRTTGPLRFLLSPRAAFVTAQPLHVTAVARALEPKWVRPLEGKVAMVTGAARGIGEATARRLAEEGAHVVCLDRPGDDALVSQVARAIGGSVLLCDISDVEAPALIARSLKDKNGGVDIVVHNAGVTRDKTLARMSEQAWEQAIEINLGSVLRINRALIDGGVLRDGGRIILLSSVAGIAGNVGQTNYAASKAGIIGLVGKQAPALAPRGITVNAVAPGFIETRLTAAIPIAIREAGRRLAALGQGGLPVDVAEVITFFASPGAQGITGQVLRACGGALIGR